VQFLSIFSKACSAWPGSSSASGARNFHAASRCRQVGVGSGVRIADLDIATTDVVIFVRKQRWRAGARFAFLERALRPWLF
jgi:hypothetical protein